MLRMQRPNNRPLKSKERVDFKFSNFQALQVPKGWDKLFVSLISVETGKTLAKSGKALLRNGSCQWAETISESIYLSNDTSSKGFEECPVKLLVSSGSTRSSHLGEVTINMAQYASSRASTSVSQSLKKCSYGTILQFKVQCLSRRLKIGDEESKPSNSQESNLDADQHDPERKSDRSYSSSRFPSEDMATTSHPMKSGSKDSASGSVRSFDSVDGYAGRKSLSGKNAFKGEVEEYDSHTTQPGGSYGNSPIPDNYSGGDDPPPKQPSLHSRLHSGEDFQKEASVSRSPMTNIGSSISLLEIAEDTIEELRVEAKMWERNARKLMIDLDVSKSEIAALSKKQAESVMQLSAARAEQEGLKKEIEKLKLELQKWATNQAIREDNITQSESLIQIQKELENEMKHQQELNDDLGQQLKQSQESNIALVLVLQELEETIEQQKMEIENLSSQKLDLMDLENSIARDAEDDKTSFLQLQKLQDSVKKLQADVQFLEKALRDKTDELENERNSNAKKQLSIEKDYKNKMSVKEEEIAGLQAMLSGYVNGKNFEVLHESNAEFIKEIESLKGKVQELEKDCAELTDENLELVYRLKDLNKTDIRKCASFDSISSEHPNVSPSDRSEVSDPKYQTSQLEEELDSKAGQEVSHPGFKSTEHLTEVLKQIDMAFNLLMKPWHCVSYHESETSNNVVDVSEGNTTSRMTPEYILNSLQEVNKLLGMRITKSEEILRNQEIALKEKNDIIADAETKMTVTGLKIQEFEELIAQSEEIKENLVKELDQKRSEFEVMETNFVTKEQNNNFLLQRRRELETEISDVQQKNSHLQQNMVLVVRERDTFSEHVENLQNDLAALRTAVSSHVSANSDLERNLEELERKRHELEKMLSGMQEEKMKLQEYIFGLEAQVRQLEDEKETALQEADDLKNVAANLRGEIKKLQVEMDTQIFNLKQMSEDMKKKWSGAQEECEYLKGENKTLHTSVVSLTEENLKLQNSNSELNMVNQELEGSCSELVGQLKESKESLSDCMKKNESLEKHLTSVLHDFTLQENSLKSEIEALVKENGQQREKLAQDESLRQMFLEQSTEFESLQKEVEHLTKQVSDARQEKEQISFEASGEVSRLLADKAQLQTSLQEVQFRAELAENKLSETLQESELRVEDLTGQLAASQKSYERLMVDHDRILKRLANYKKSEEKLKTSMNDLDLKLTISDCERQQLTKEMSILKGQLQTISDLQDEVSNLKEKLKQCRLDKGKLELALKTVSRDYEELKAEKISLSEKVAECKRNKSVLEEKLVQIEKELNAKEILYIQNDDLKNEISEMKRANMQLQQKMYRLEVDRDEYLKKAQTLEEDLNIMKERNNIFKEVANYSDFHDEISHAISGDHMTKRQMPENEISEGLDENSRSGVQGDRKSNVTGEIVARERYERTKSSLQAELRELRERYLEMSLKYAEVEAQREDLVMKLKAARPGRRWFS